MKKIFILGLLLMTTVGISIQPKMAIAQEEMQEEEIQVSEEVLKQYEKNNESVKQNGFWDNILRTIQKEDYVFAIYTLNNRLKIRPNDYKAVYYLALCYQKLGFAKEAQQEYKKIIEARHEVHPTLVQYAKKASACIDDPKSALCLGKLEVKPVLSEEEKRHQAEVNELKAQIKALQEAQAPVVNKNKDDITLFIESKQKIHPAAVDRITVERMERKLQADDYAKKQKEENNK